MNSFGIIPLDVHLVRFTPQFQPTFKIVNEHGMSTGQRLATLETTENRPLSHGWLWTPSVLLLTLERKMVQLPLPSGLLVRRMEYFSLALSGDLTF